MHALQKNALCAAIGCTHHSQHRSKAKRTGHFLMKPKMSGATPRKKFCAQAICGLIPTVGIHIIPEARNLHRPTTTALVTACVGRPHVGAFAALIAEGDQSTPAGAPKAGQTDGGAERDTPLIRVPLDAVRPAPMRAKQ